MARAKNRGLVYARRSTDKQEISLPNQIEWAIAAATRQGVTLDAAVSDLEHMQASRLFSFRDVRLDDGISGSDLTRPGFLAVNRDALADKTVSHVFIYKRDRFARPNDAMEAAKIEKDWLSAGITLVFSDAVSAPIRMGDQSIMRDMELLLAYYQDGEELRKHAEPREQDMGEERTMQDLPRVREVHGFRRTECGCAFCTVYCRHMPGTLDPADLIPLCRDEQDVLVWAEQHLRALVDQPYPTLVPARNHQGHCHWYFDGQCVVHENAPYGCAFFDAHQSEEEVTRRAAATIQACKEDAAANGPYYRVWRHLCVKGLIARRGDRQALCAEIQEMRRRVRRSQRRMTRGY